ncbi:MAG: ATP-binding protein [Gammaproteobacteria bacterium]|nr:ATP-binding protein [Gammaproteobacteria bacterium]
MADKLPSLAGDRSDKNYLVGSDVLHLVTSGMYTNPLTVYREYVQNAADAIASSQTRNGRVVIALDIGKLCVQIRDNGPGLSYREAQRELIPISKSRKHRRRDRGFRGIGRLCGLAFGTSVSFLTRRSKNDPVTKVTWNRVSLQNGIDKNLSVEKTILQSTTVEKLKEGDYPPNFFEVQIHGISRYAAAAVLNKEVVRNYIGETCPVPFGTDFPYANNVLNLLGKNSEQVLAIDIRIDGEETPITRLHGESVAFSGDRIDKFTDFEAIKIPGLNSNNYAAIGWMVHTSYLGALPAKAGIRCLRARCGNIQIGDESVFDHLFSEVRFNRWCTAEVHILDPRIVPNGRRDYFEPGAHLRNLENHLSALCRKLEQRVRVSSQDRNRQRNFQTFLEKMEESYKLATSGYLTADVARQFAGDKIAEIEQYKVKCQHTGDAGNIKALEKWEKKFAPSNIRARRKNSLSGVKSSEISIYRGIFEILAQASSSPQEAIKTIESILKHKSSNSPKRRKR